MGKNSSHISENFKKLCILQIHESTVQLVQQFPMFRSHIPYPVLLYQSKSNEQCGTSIMNFQQLLQLEHYPFIEEIQIPQQYHLIKEDILTPFFLQCIKMSGEFPNSPKHLGFSFSFSHGRHQMEGVLSENGIVQNVQNQTPTF